MRSVIASFAAFATYNATPTFCVYFATAPPDFDDGENTSTIGHGTDSLSRPWIPLLVLNHSLALPSCADFIASAHAFLGHATPNFSSSSPHLALSHACSIYGPIIQIWICACPPVFPGATSSARTYTGFFVHPLSFFRCSVISRESLRHADTIFLASLPGDSPCGTVSVISFSDHLPSHPRYERCISLRAYRSAFALCSTIPACNLYFRSAMHRAHTRHAPHARSITRSTLLPSRVTPTNLPHGAPQATTRPNRSACPRIRCSCQTERCDWSASAVLPSFTAPARNLSRAARARRHGEVYSSTASSHVRHFSLAVSELAQLCPSSELKMGACRTTRLGIARGQEAASVAEGAPHARSSSTSATHPGQAEQNQRPRHTVELPHRGQSGTHAATPTMSLPGKRGRATTLPRRSPSRGARLRASSSPSPTTQRPTPCSTRQI